MIYVHLAFMIELCSEFVRAHQAVDIHELMDEGTAADILQSENHRQLERVHDLMAGQVTSTKRRSGRGGRGGRQP